MTLRIQDINFNFNEFDEKIKYKLETEIKSLLGKFFFKLKKKLFKNRQHNNTKIYEEQNFI